MRRLLFLVLVLLAAGSATVLVATSADHPAGPGVTPDQVADEFVAGGTWNKSAGAEFLPDGRMLVLETTGRIHLVNPVTGSSSLWMTIPDVSTAGETGLLDLTLDRSYATNHIFYTYLVEASTSRLRVDRFTVGATGAETLASRQRVWTNPGPAVNMATPFHVGGSLNVGPDGNLYLTTGENTTASNAQDLRNVFGKVLRFGTDGTVPSDNPYYDGAGPHVDEIWATGVRNGFRSSFDTNGDYWLGDVGGNNAPTAYEEVDLVTRGANYGWPSCEGPLGQPKNGASCPSGVTGPLYAYPHDSAGSCCLNRAIVGGEVYRGSAFPASFVGTYVYADYPTGEVFWLQRNGSTATSGLLKKVFSGGLPVWVGVSPADGNIYYVHYGFGNGALRRLRYTGARNQPPVITRASATPTSGAAPLSVAFSGAATDADGDAVAYHWTFGDGTTADTPNPTRVYATAGAYTAQLTVTAGADSVTSPPIAIAVGTPPTATITSPTPPVAFTAGDTITVDGAGTAADGSALPGSSLRWNVAMAHDDHTHPVTSGTGASITWAVPLSGSHSWAGRTGYVVTLTATGVDGLTATATLRLDPVKTPIPVSANIPVDVTVDGIALAQPTTIDALVGSQHTISAPIQVCVGTTLWRFAAWSDEGARDHTFVAPAGAPPLAATYTPGTAGTCGNQLYRAIDIAGRALTVGGVAFEDGRSAPGFTAGPITFCDPSVPLIPPTSPGESELIRCSAYGIGNSSFTVGGVPDGNYQVTIWTWEDNTSEVWTPSLNGVPQPPVTSGPAGTWRRLTYPVTVGGGAGRIALTSSGGVGNLSAVRIDTVLGADGTPPTVVSVTPPDGSVGVAGDTAVSVTFSEPVTPNGGVALTDDAGTPVPTIVAPSGRTVTLTPSALLAPGARYRVVVGPAVTDAAGNPAVAATTTFTVRTGAAGQLLVSRAATRASSVGLDGDTWTVGESVYVHYDTTATDPAVGVRFYLDAPATGTAVHLESLAPWDFNGGGTSTAFPFVNNLAPGPHTITAAATRADGSTDTVTATFTVGSGATTTTTTGSTTTTSASTTTTTTGATTTTTAPATGGLRVARAADRSGAVALAGETWNQGDAEYVFLDVTDPGVGVRFFLDGPVTGTPFHLESLAPWDFNGGGSATAFPYVNNLAPGAHTITAVLTGPNGTSVTYTATFTVAAPATTTTNATTTTTAPTTTSGSSTTLGSTTTTGGATTSTLPPLSGLRVSRSANRSAAVALAGNLWDPGESVYVFLDVTEPGVSVRFFLDGPATGTPFHIESLAPWDFNGGGTAAAVPYVNRLVPGAHTVTAVLTRPDGSAVTYTATFTATA